MRGAAISTSKHRGADPAASVFPIKFGSGFVCESLCASKNNHSLTCRFGRSVGSSLGGGFQWEE